MKTYMRRLKLLKLVELERRISALEAHITDLEERLNARRVFSGDPVK